MSLKDTLRDRLVELRVDERDLVEQQEATAAKLETNRSEQSRVKAQLLRDSETTLRMQATTHESARGTVARLGSFTFSELKAELGWETPRVKKLMATLECEKPPAIEPDGKFGTKPMFKYTGKPIEVSDAAERDAAALEAVREWSTAQTSRFTPAECAAALDESRAATLRHLRTMEQMGVVTDVGPTQDMPIFEVTGLDAPDVAIDRPDLKLVEKQPMSKIPQIQELIEAAQAAQCEVTPANGHFAIEALDGRRAIIDAKPQGRSRLMQDKSKLRRLGVRV